MKTLFSSAKRILALVLALLLMVPAMGVAFAANEGNPVYLGGPIANFHSTWSGLTEEEAALLRSDYLKGAVKYYYDMEEGAESTLVAVDTDAKTITAKSTPDGAGNEWVPVSATIVPSEGAEELVTLTRNGEDWTGTYVYDGNAFSVEVDYELTIVVDVPEQQELLDLMAELRSAFGALEGVYNGGGNFTNYDTIGAIDSAVPDLMEIVTNGIVTGIPADDERYAQFSKITMESPDADAAVTALHAQQEANGGWIDLYATLSEYADSKVEYLLNNTKDTVVEQTETFVGYLVDILGEKTDKEENYTGLYRLQSQLAGVQFLISYSLVQLEDEQIEAINRYATLMNTAVEAAEKLINRLTNAIDPSVEGWDLVGNITNPELVVNPDSGLDTLVAALPDGYVSDVDPSVMGAFGVLVGSTTLTVGMNMHDVTVEMTMIVTTDEVDSRDGVTVASETKVLTLAHEATAQDIEDAIEASGFVAETLVKWKNAGYYIEDHFVTAFFVGDQRPVFGLDDLDTILPEALTEDLTISVAADRLSYEVTAPWLDAEEFNLFPYGYKMTLPKHDDPLKAYDYKVNGVPYAQGSVITIEGYTTITRTEGKAYEFGTLYSIIVENLGGGKAASMLSSGALTGDEEVAYRVPGEDQVTLSAGVLTAGTYPSDYAGLSWVPYYTLVNGTNESERQPVNGSVDLSSETYDQVKVYYVLELTNYDSAYVSTLMGQLNGLVEEADGQLATLNRLAAYHSTMGQLDKTKLGALNGVIDVTDFTPDDGIDTDDKNLELRAYFKSMVGGIIANNLDSNNYLKIYNMLGEYLDETNGGLTWYYLNHEALRAEIDSLSGYLTGMLADDEKVAALGIMVTKAGYPEYAEKIADLQKVMSEVKATLTAPNAMIKTDDEAKLKALVAAMTGDGEVDTTYATVPYVELDSINKDAEDKVSITVEIKIQTGDETYKTNKETITKDIGYVLTQNDIDDLVSRAVSHVTVDANFYYNDWDVEVLNALEGTEIAAQTITFTWNVKPFEVDVEGYGMNQTITILDTIIVLPAAPDGWRYEYLIDGNPVSATNSYHFDLENLYGKFDGGDDYYGGTYTVERIETNLAQEKLEGFVKAINDAIGRDALVLNADYTGITADLTANDLQGFIMGLVNGGYGYVGLNGEGFFYTTDDNDLEICLQTLVNAILDADVPITDADVINGINENGEGAVSVDTSIQLGNSAADTTDLDFILTLDVTGLPYVDMGRNLLAQANNVQGRDLLDFTTAVDSFAVTVTLPDKVYEVYVAALTLVDSPNVSDNVDLSDVNAVNAAVAYQFLLDYIKVLTTGDVTLTTIHNTAAKLGQEAAVDQFLSMLEGYEQYVDKALAYLGDALAYDAANNYVTLDLTAGSGAISSLLNTVAPGIPELYLSYIKEMKDGNSLSALVTVTVSNFNDTDNDGYVDSNYEAIIVDAGKVDTANLVNSAAAFDMTENLAADLAGLTGPAVVMLQKDVAGPLYFDTTVILDLNGCDIANGFTVGPKGKVFIFDSKMGTADCGTVSGDVTVDENGALTVTGGKYTNADVSRYVRVGYAQNADGSVSNKFYTISANGNDITFNVSADIVTLNETPDVKFLAADIAVDLLLNYYTTAKLTVGGYNVYNVDFSDLFVLLDLADNTERVNEVLDTVIDVSVETGLSGLTNDIAAKLLDFGTMSANIKAGKPVITYSVTTAPWVLNVEHESNGDYIAVGVTPGTAKNGTVKVAVTGTAANKKEVTDLLDALEEIVVVENGERQIGASVSFDDPLHFEDSNLVITGTGSVNAKLDLSKDDYPVVIAAILAYGNADLRGEALNSAITAYLADDGDFEALKTILDGVTVNEIFTALKAMGRNVPFTTMVETAGITVGENATELESVYHKLLIVAGAALDYLEIDGGSRTLGNQDGDDDGVYTANKTVNPAGTREIARGYGVAYDLTVNVDLSVKLFGEKSEEEEIDPPYFPISGHCPACDKNHCASKQFSDLKVGPDSWYHKYTDYVICLELMIGKSATEFVPAGETNRAMLVTTLYRFAGSPEVSGEMPYVDVAEGQWYSDAIIWATQNGIVNGYGNGYFGPFDTLTREQSAAMFYRYAKLLGLDVSGSDAALAEFEDADQVSAWAVDAVKWAVTSGMMNGRSTTELILRPKYGTTRAETAALLYRWCEEIAD